MTLGERKEVGDINILRKKTSVTQPLLLNKYLINIIRQKYIGKLNKLDNKCIRRVEFFQRGYLYARDFRLKDHQGSYDLNRVNR